MQNFDSLIFDMDGTLWDAVDSYCAVWNRTIDEFGLPVGHVDRPGLQKLVGVPIADIFTGIIGKIPDEEAFIKALAANEASMMPSLGGRLYPGVRTTLEELSKTKKLFMVSNCEASGLPNFFAYTGLGDLFTGGLSYGETRADKDLNIHRLIEEYDLKNPLYVGDTESDCLFSHLAGVPFAWASYGFGKNVSSADYVLNSFEDLLTICKS